ncbi:prolyl aminopeptidase [Metamycoplasma equirhinis]|uniref:prolyl aminopeptidase n=1 Tax=Metamycoplasma equirhinis TaxID=92402 RepID=UPI0035941A7C
MKLYEINKPYNTGRLKVSGLHSIYFEEVGNPNGKPILFVHGGPGGGFSESASQYFDPKFYRIILFDQRGCGKSTPTACIEENTTLDLVSDIEKIREFLKIEKWTLFGGSWGSTLSLIYSIYHPKRVNGLILRGIFLGRKEDDNWLYQSGASFYFPKEYKEYSEVIEPSKRNNLISAYHELLNSKDEKIAENAAYHWAKWELGLITLNPIKEIEEILQDKKANLELARLENNYFYNHIFLEDDNFILVNCEKITHIKTIIIHGRYDMDCRPIGAYLLHKKMQNSDLRIIDGAGHSTREEAIAIALVTATEEFKNFLKN